MSQTHNSYRAQPRFSRRQVTKRTFNVLGSPNILQNVPPDKNVKPQSVHSTQNKKASAKKENECTKDANIHEDDAYNDENEAESVHTPQKQQKLDGVEYSPAPGDVSVSFLASTPKPGRPQLSRRRPMSPVTETLVRPQSKQIISSSQERTEINFTNNHLLKQQRVNCMEDENGNLSRKQMGKESQRKKSPLKQSSLKGSPQKQTGSPLKRGSPQKSIPGSSITEKIALINKSRLEKKRNNSDIRNKNSVSKTEKILNISKTKESNSSVPGHKTESFEIKSRGKKEKVPVLNVKTSKTRLNRTQVDSRSNIKNVTDLAETQMSLNNRGFTSTDKGHSETDKSIYRRRNDTTVTNEASSVLERQESERNLSPTRLRNRGTSIVRNNSISSTQRNNGTSSMQRNNVTTSVQRNNSTSSILRNNGTSNMLRNNKTSSTRGDEDDDLSISVSIQDRRSTVNSKLKSLSKKKAVPNTSTEDMSSAIDQTMMVWEADGQKRSRGDLFDLDVVLNTVTETLEARLDVYDTDEEQSAVRLLGKYLTKDITHMIQGVQTVTGLQVKIKRSRQSVKQKQKSLMALQKERIEKEEKCEPLKKQMKCNQNLKTINQFLMDLSNIIEQC